MADYRSWTGPARAMALAVDAAVGAAQAGDVEAFDRAVAELARADREQLIVVLGAVTRTLLERSHPDGFSSEDAEQVLQSCVRAAAWYPALDTDALVVAFTGAVGVGDVDELPALDQRAVVVHGVLLIADLLTSSALGLTPLLEDELRELMRDQTIELP